MGPRGLVPFTYDFYLNIQILNYLIMLKTMTDHKIGTREEWLAARLELLKAEKALTRRSDELAQWRQKLPWVRIDKEYRFDTDEGTASLADLFTLGQMSSKILKLLFLLHKADNKNNNKRLDYWVI